MTSSLPENAQYFYGVGTSSSLVFVTVASVLTQGGSLQAFVSNDGGKALYELYVRTFTGSPHAYTASLINPHGREVIQLGASRYGEHVALGNGHLLRQRCYRSLTPVVHILQSKHRRLCEGFCQ